MSDEPKPPVAFVAVLTVVTVGVLVAMWQVRPWADSNAPSAAPPPAAASTSSSPPTTEPAPDPIVVEPATEAAADGDLGARVSGALGESVVGGHVPAWMLPIVGVETLGGDTVRIHYQEALSDEEAEVVGGYVRNFAAPTVPELRVVVVRDTSGVDRNVY